MTKSPKSKFQPSENKLPRIKSNPESFDKETPAWHLNILDTSGPWGWKNCTEGHFWEIILDKIRSLESMTWADILRGNNNHRIEVFKICSDAKKRLIEIRQNDIDELYSLGLANKPRLWGIRDGRIFKVLWWDPDHSVCPSVKKHT